MSKNNDKTAHHTLKKNSYESTADSSWQAPPLKNGETTPLGESRHFWKQRMSMKDAKESNGRYVLIQQKRTLAVPRPHKAAPSVERCETKSSPSGWSNDDDEIPTESGTTVNCLVPYQHVTSYHLQLTSLLYNVPDLLTISPLSHWCARARAKGGLSINYGYFTQFCTQFSHTTKFCWRAAVAEYEDVHIITIAPIQVFVGRGRIVVWQILPKVTISSVFGSS